jgi:hypothetical protein
MVLWQEILIVLGCIVAGFMIGLLLMFLFRRKKLKPYLRINKESDFIKTEDFKGTVATPLNNRINKLSMDEDPLELLVKNHKNSINAENSKQPVTALVTPGNQQLVEEPKKFSEQIISPEPAIISRKNILVTEEPEKTSMPFVLKGSEITAQNTTPIAENQKVFPEQNKPEPEILRPINTTRVESQEDSPNSGLIKELETNLAIATTPWANKLIPFQTKYWYSKHGESELLLTSHYKELMPLYVDMGLANNIVWLATEIGHRSKELDESYIKLCSGIADGLKRIMSSFNETD